jgi:hypothetical protein
MLLLYEDKSPNIWMKNDRENIKSHQKRAPKMKEKVRQFIEKQRLSLLQTEENISEESIQQDIENKGFNISVDVDKIAAEIEKPIVVRNIKHARRLLSKLISKLQKGEIKGREAKDMTYLLISFVNIIKEEEIETKLNNLEMKINEMKSEDNYINNY